MTEALYAGATFGIDSYKTFMKKNKQYVKSVISKIGALFVKALFEIIKNDIVALVKSVLVDLVKEKLGKKYKMILQLVAVLYGLIRIFNDYRECKSVIDELLYLLNLARQIRASRNAIPLPILFGAQLLDGYSETRAFIDFISNLEKLGIPTGAMPDGSPNLTLMSMYSQMKSSASEDAQNGMVQIAIGPLSITPAGLTVPSNAFGKKF
jgi:hypothetical protein